MSYIGEFPPELNEQVVLPPDASTVSEYIDLHISTVSDVKSERLPIVEISDTVQTLINLMTEKQEGSKRLAIGMSLAGLRAGLNFRTNHILSRVVNNPDKNAENDVEKDAIEYLNETACSLVAGVLEERNKTKLGKAVEAVSSTKIRRLIGKATVGAAFAVPTGLVINIFTKASDKMSGVIGIGGGLAALGYKQLNSVAKSSARAVAKALQGKITRNIDQIPIDRREAINEQIEGYSEEEAIRLCSRLQAEELTRPLKEKMEIEAFRSDLNGDEGEKDAVTPMQLAEKLSTITVDFISELFDIKGAVNKKTKKQVAVNAGKRIVGGLVGGSEVTREIRDSTIDIAEKEVKNNMGI